MSSESGVPSSSNSGGPPPSAVLSGGAEYFNFSLPTSSIWFVMELRRSRPSSDKGQKTTRGSICKGPSFSQ
eukprot:8738024-Pyramimonas_sp.AAC.1